MNGKSQEYHFIYKNQEYDATDYVNKHPGGREFLDKFIDEKKDITEYFATLHSKKALKVLESFKIIRQDYKETQTSQRYFELREKVIHLYKPNWIKEALLILGTLWGLIYGSLCTNWWLAIFILCVTQIIAGWEGHSQNHSRNPVLYAIGQMYGPMIGGFSPKWWNRKHNLHHMFTNHIKKDEDIQHNYNRFLFPLLFLKWKMDGILTEYKSWQIVFIIFHWLVVMNQKVWIMMVAQLIAGFFAATILVGNHEKERIFEDRINLEFFDHQIQSTKNYPHYDFISIVIMGGMQFQTEHHLYPQIPFYNLPAAREILVVELKKYGLEIKVGPILS